MTQPCPQQTHAIMQVQKLHESEWHKDGTCSYCGSISPDIFFKALEDGCKLTPTDKNYKVYVDLPNAKPGELVVSGWANSKPTYGNWFKANMVNRIKYRLSKDTKYFMLSPRGETKQTKFYMDHLSEDEKQRLIDMINAKSINFASPGYFYVLPFFVQRSEPVHG